MELKKTVAAENYLANSGMQTEHGLNLLEKLNPAQGEFILDLGCGTGNLSSVIAEKLGANGRLVGVDPDGARIAVARKTFGHVENLEFVEGSSDTLANDFGKACFDAVFINYVFHWVKDKKRAFENIFEILKPGGRVAMLYNTEIPPLFDKVAKELNPEENYIRIREMICYEAKEIVESYFIDTGHAIIESIEIQQRAVHENLSDYLIAVSAATYGIFDLGLIEEQNFQKFHQWIDKKGRFIHDFPLGIVLACKTLPLQ